MDADKRRFTPELVLRILLLILFAYFFFGFMLMPCLNTLASIFNVKNADGVRDPLAVIRFDPFKQFLKFFLETLHFPKQSFLVV